jgi:hypothetical protein
MDDVNSGYLGAAIHGALAVVAVCEGLALKSRQGKLLAGSIFGWHAYAMLYHINERRNTRNSRRKHEEEQQEYNCPQAKPFTVGD